MLSTHDAGQLVAIANARCRSRRLALIGDTKQLGAVEASRSRFGQDAATVLMIIRTI
jgi:hypothetical protein